MGGSTLRRPSAAARSAKPAATTERSRGGNCARDGSQAAVRQGQPLPCAVASRPENSRPICAHQPTLLLRMDCRYESSKIQLISPQHGQCITRSAVKHPPCRGLLHFQQCICSHGCASLLWHTECQHCEPHDHVKRKNFVLAQHWAAGSTSLISSGGSVGGRGRLSLARQNCTKV